MSKKHTRATVGMRELSPTTWSEVWRHWKKDEGSLKKWQPHYRREGYSSWSAWRKAVVVRPFRVSAKRWTLYRVDDPSVIRFWHGGPFPRWVLGRYHGAQTRTFRWLADSGQSTEEGKKIQLKPLPRQMFMFGLIYRGRIVVLDGMHRCLAIVTRLEEGKLVKAKITIALAKVNRLPKLKPSLK